MGGCQMIAIVWLHVCKIGVAKKYLELAAGLSCNVIAHSARPPKTLLQHLTTPQQTDLKLH